MVQVATPLELRVTAEQPEIEAPFEVNATVPVGAGELTGVTVAVSVTVWLVFDGFGLEVRVVVVWVWPLPCETVTATPADAIPLATTYKVLVPVSAVEGTSKLVDTIVPPVAMPMVLWPCVLA